MTYTLPQDHSTIISEKGRGLGLVTPRKFHTPSTISRKLIKLQTSNLVHSFLLALHTRMKYHISERGRGLGHVTPRKFRIPSTISRKPIKLETSNLVHSFTLALPTRTKCHISERGRGLGHVTPRKFGIPLTISGKNKARDLEFHTQLHIGPSHKNEVPYF